MDRAGRFSGPTLPADVLERLERQFRSAGWWRDRWRQRGFRDLSREILRTAAPDGLVIVGPNMGFSIPPPFHELFEPLEFGVSDDQWQVLSGDPPTRHERIMQIALWAWSAVLLGCLVPIVTWIIFAGQIPRTMSYLFGVFAGIPLFTLAIIFLVKTLHGKWFLMPGAVAVIRGRPGRGGRAELFTRLDSVASIRWVSNGKSSSLVLELHRSGQDKRHRPIRDREAIAFLAAWQSRLPPRATDHVQELAG